VRADARQPLLGRPGTAAGARPRAHRVPARGAGPPAVASGAGRRRRRRPSTRAAGSRRVPRAPGRRAHHQPPARHRQRGGGARPRPDTYRCGHHLDARPRQRPVIVPGPAGVHLTYCTNIHPGETWDEVAHTVRTYVPEVKARIGPGASFGVGLRLSGQAAGRLAAPDALDAFREELDRLGLYVFTINGFPFGAFHGRPVKEEVYRPDWLDEERRVYADSLAPLLAGLMAGRATGEGSVSTVPGCFLGRAASSRDAAAAVAHNVLRHAVHLWRIREETGLTVGLALEPEPHCLLETTADAAAFFERHLFAPGAVAAFADRTGLSRAGAEEALRRHVGVCLDACHA